MKKLHVLIPSLVTTVGMPLISLVGCGEKEVPPKPDIIYTLSQFTAQPPFVAVLLQDDLVFQQGKTYKIVIDFNLVVSEWWDYLKFFSIAYLTGEGPKALLYDVLWVDVNGYKFSNKKSDDVWYEYTNGALILHNYQDRLKAANPIINVYIIPQSNCEGATASAAFDKRA